MEHSAGLGHMDTLLRQLDEAQDLAEANSGVVRSISWAAAQAGAWGSLGAEHVVESGYGLSTEVESWAEETAHESALNICCPYERNQY